MIQLMIFMHKLFLFKNRYETKLCAIKQFKSMLGHKAGQ